MTNAIRAAAAALALATALAGPAPAQSAARIPVSIVAGRLVVRCDVSTRARRIPASLFVDYESTAGLELHNKAADGIRAEDGDGSGLPITVHLPGLELSVERRELGDDEELDRFTKWHSKELGEVAVVGTIGSKLFADYHAVFDLAAGVIELSPPRAERREPPRDVEGATDAGARASFTLPITLRAGVVWLPVRRGDGIPAALGLATGAYDTTVDEELCWSLERPDGDVGPVRLGAIDLTKYVALRPAPVRYVHPDGALGLTGLGLLRHFRVEVDRVNLRARLTPTAPPDFPVADRAFFAARAEDTCAALERYLDEHPASRLAREAATELVDRRLIEGATDEEVRRALELVDRTSAPDLRATSALEQMERCQALGSPRHLVMAGEVGVESGRDDRYPNAVHEIHSSMGAVLLELGDGERAWKHLLSAAFGIPDDGMVNLNLGRYYESDGRLRRAYSRYVQAVIRPDSGPAAIEALARVQAKMGGERFSVDLVERMIAGKVRNFGAATRYEPAEGEEPRRTVLVEYFTNAHLGDANRGAIGGALANEGLIGHFPPEHVAFLSHHLPEPKLDPLVCELAASAAGALAVEGPWVHVVDGLEHGPGAGRYRDAEAIYNGVRRSIVDRLGRASDYSIAIDAQVEGDVVRGTLTILGPPRNGLRVHLVLAEAGVLFPGESSVVVHRMVARGPLLGFEGRAWKPTDGAMTIDFERSLADLQAENEAYLDELASAGAGAVTRISTAIDPAQVRLVAYLRDFGGGATHQAAQVAPEHEDVD